MSVTVKNSDNHKSWSRGI